MLLSFSSPARPREVADILAFRLRRTQARTPRWDLDEAPCLCQGTILSRHLVSNNSDDVVLMTTEVSTPLYERRPAILAADCCLLHRSQLRTTVCPSSR